MVEESQCECECECASVVCMLGVLSQKDRQTDKKDEEIEKFRMKERSKQSHACLFCCLCLSPVLPSPFLTFDGLTPSTENALSQRVEP